MTRVLLIEDNLAILESISFELEMRGYEVAKAVDGHEAIKVLQQTEPLPDIIVSDIAMPNLDGYKLLELVQGNECWHSIPFIYLTAFSSPNAIRIGKELGVDDYLVKPFQADDLVVAMENKLRRVRQFRDSAERQLDHVRRELIDVISHELRTPLTAIYGGAEMLADSLQTMPDPLAQNMLDLVRSGAKRMNRLVNQILYLVQIDGGFLNRLMHEHTRLCDLSAIVQQACDQVQLNWHEVDVPNVSLTIHTPNEPLWVQGLQDFLLMAVEEVIRNAMMFSSEGSSVSVHVWQDQDMVFVRIEDQGQGIPADHLDRIWERFVQVNRYQNEQQGIGLGLSLVRDSIRAHDGQCQIESQEGKGTAVTLQLPLAIASDRM